MHVYGFVALSSQFLFLPLFLYDGVVVIVILMAFSGLVLFATLSYFPLEHLPQRLWDQSQIPRLISTSRL